MLLSQFFTERYQPDRLFGKSPETSRLIRYSISSFTKTLGHAAAIADLTDANIRRHMMRVVNAGRSPATANKDCHQLLAIWRHAAKCGLISTQPTVQTLPQPIRTPRAWTADECAALLDTCRHLDGMVGQVPAKVWWLSLVQTCLDTGERIGAITAARWSWISGDWILVPAEHRKGGKRDRQYRLGELTLITLAAQRKYQRSDEVWHWPQSRTYLWTRFRAVLRKAGLPDDRRSSFHRLRRTTASVCHAAGLDASEALDHADRRTTRAYLDPRFARTTQAADVLADFLSNPPPRRDKRIG